MPTNVVVNSFVLFACVRSKWLWICRQVFWLSVLRNLCLLGLSAFPFSQWLLW